MNAVAGSSTAMTVVINSKFARFITSSSGSASANNAYVLGVVKGSNGDTNNAVLSSASPDIRQKLVTAKNYHYEVQSKYGTVYNTLIYEKTILTSLNVHYWDSVIVLELNNIK